MPKSNIVNQPSYIKGMVSNDTLRSVIPPGLDENRAVFVFPSNTGHHRKDGSAKSLFTPKRGGGLAKASSNWGDADNPTLGLPTTGMPVVKSPKDVGIIAHGAITDLYKAMGAGFHLIIPIRPHKKRFFENGLDGEPGFEPSFWGGIDTTLNKGLAKFYIDELNKLDPFAKLLDAQSKKTPSEEDNLQLQQFKEENPSLWEAYQEGQKASAKNDPWYTNPNMKVVRAQFGSLDELKKEFINLRNMRLAKEYFKIFRRSGLTTKSLSSMNFEDIVNYAQNGKANYSGNRSLQILIDINVLDSNKQFTKQFKAAHPEFVSKYQSYDSLKPDF
jgi:hypothetical protein